MDKLPSPRRAYRHFDLIMVSFVAVMMISNVASSKILEVYGYARSRRVIWAGFAANLLMAAMFAVVGALPPAEGWAHQKAYEAILSMTPRIVAGSLIAYFVGTFSNSWILAKMKVLTKGRWLWSRTIASTLVGEGIDTLAHCLLWHVIRRIAWGYHHLELFLQVWTGGFGHADHLSYRQWAKACGKGRLL